jgi:hypothetical protein
VCGSAASTGLCGGQRATAVPTATVLRYVYELTEERAQHARLERQLDEAPGRNRRAWALAAADFVGAEMGSRVPVGQGCEADWAACEAARRANGVGHGPAPLKEK